MHYLLLSFEEVKVLPVDFQISVETESGPHPPELMLANAGFELSQVAFCEVNPQFLSWINHHESSNRFYITTLP